MGPPFTNRTSVRDESLSHIEHDILKKTRANLVSERQSGNYDPPDKSRAWWLPHPARNHRAPPRHDLGGR